MIQAIQKRSLGKTDIRITPIGLGAMEFSGGKGMIKYLLAPVPPDTQDEVICTAIENGTNWIDTAELYGSGYSEISVAKGLKAAGVKPEDVVISTKWFPILKRAKSMRKSARKSIERLAPYPIGLYIIHMPYSVSSVKTQMKEMANLFESGLIRAIGVSNFSKSRMIKAHEALEEWGIPLAANQMQFSLLHRNIETNGVLEAAKDLGVTIIAYTPLGQGVLTGNLHHSPTLLHYMPRLRRSRLSRQLEKTHALIETLESIACEHEAKAAQIALSWTTTYHGDTIVAIPGASKTYQAEQNAKAMRIQLTSEQKEAISSISLEL
ncbi:MAG: aldo/keto reductase [Candidatus Thorarchaeota archaeon]|nr:aldo/keto reductase [Candidatus Thorarchaeota archaeon]